MQEPVAPQITDKQLQTHVELTQPPVRVAAQLQFTPLHFSQHISIAATTFLAAEHPANAFVGFQQSILAQILLLALYIHIVDWMGFF